MAIKITDNKVTLTQADSVTGWTQGGSPEGSSSKTEYHTYWKKKKWYQFWLPKWRTVPSILIKDAKDSQISIKIKNEFQNKNRSSNV